MAKLFFLLAMFVGCMAVFELSNSKFLAYLKKFKKNRGLLEQSKRFTVWKGNMKKLKVLIEKAKGRGYEVGENEFTDLTEEEMSKYWMTGNFSTAPSDFLHLPVYEINAETNDTHARVARQTAGKKDWRDYFGKWDVKTQGVCGSCWAFAVVSALELQYYWRHDRFRRFSEQHLVDCSPNTFGCKGGWPHFALDFSREHGNYEESTYPYYGEKGACREVGGTLKIVQNYYRIPDAAGMVDFLQKTGPIIFWMVISHSFVNYKSGIYNPLHSECKFPSPDLHAMAIVGYGSEGGKDFWIVRNSWGRSWGEDGYMRIVRGTNVCHCEGGAIGPIVL